MLDVGVAPGKYDMNGKRRNPLGNIVSIYNFRLWKEEGWEGRRFFSHATAPLEYAKASAENLNPKPFTLNSRP